MENSKIFIALIFNIISLTTFGQSVTNFVKTQTAPDSIYPPTTYLPSYAKSWSRTTYYPNRINVFNAALLVNGGYVYIGNSITEFGGDFSERLGVAELYSWFSYENVTLNHDFTTDATHLNDAG